MCIMPSINRYHTMKHSKTCVCYTCSCGHSHICEKCEEAQEDLNTNKTI
jgi:hypothetical protein